MKKITIFLCFLGFAITAQPLKIPKKTRLLYTNCYTDSSTDIRSKLQIDGYFIHIDHHEKTCYGYGKNYTCYDASILYIFFYEDGTFWQSASEPYYDTTDLGYPQKAFERQMNRKPFGEGFPWGMYKLVGDTIVAQSFFNGNSALAPKFVISEIKYIILNKVFIEYLPRNSRLIMDNKQLKEKQQSIKDRKITEEHILPKNEIYTFVPYEKIPPPDCWLKKQDWLKCK